MAHTDAMTGLVFPHKIQFSKTCFADHYSYIIFQKSDHLTLKVVFCFILLWLFLQVCRQVTVEKEPTVYSHST